MQKVCIIVPCYNEAQRIKVSDFRDFLFKHNDINFCFVNDGSKDNTLELLNEFKNSIHDRVIILNLEKNCGKSEAVRRGVIEVSQKNTYDIVGFWDADLSTPLPEIIRMVEIIRSNPEYNACFGSRVKRMGARIMRKGSRHYLGRIFSTFSNIILQFPVYDSQCGAKIFRGDTLDVIFNETFITKWLFDIEILARMRNHFGIIKISEIVMEMPLMEWKDIIGSKLKFSDYIVVPFELLKIHFHYNKSKIKK